MHRGGEVRRKLRPIKEGPDLSKKIIKCHRMNRQPT